MAPRGIILSLVNTNTVSHNTVCSCGNPAPHIVARRQTADGFDAHFWCDGSITDRVGSYVVRGRRGSAQVAAARLAGDAAAFGCGFFDRRELPDLARRAYAIALAHPGLDASAVYRRSMPATRASVDAIRATHRFTSPLIEYGPRCFHKAAGT